MLNHAPFCLVNAVWTLARKQGQILKIKVMFTSNVMIVDTFLTLYFQVRCSSRENKGSGGQVAQLQTLERLQTQASHRTSKMDVATTNEPLNPMAPSIRASNRSRGSGTKAVSDFFSVCHLFTNEQPVSEPLPNTGQGSPPTYQTATAGIHFGFRPSAYDKSRPVQNRPTPPSCAPGPTGLRGISLSCSGSVTHFCPFISFEGSHFPKKSSQVPHRVSRTYTVHNLQGQMLYPQDSQPSQYRSPQSFQDDGNQSDNHLHNSGEFPQEIYQNERPACDIEPEIDEISPDEDDRIARRALRGINNHIKLFRTNTSTDPTPEHESQDYSPNFENTRQISSDHDIGM